MGRGELGVEIGTRRDGGVWGLGGSVKGGGRGGEQQQAASGYGDTHRTRMRVIPWRAAIAPATLVPWRYLSDAQGKREK